MSHRIVITQILPPSVMSNIAPIQEQEVFRQVIDDLDLRKFVRTVNAAPRRSRAVTKRTTASQAA